MPASLVVAPTNRLQEVRPRALSALAARTARVITLTAPTALGLFGAPFHEPFHADGRKRSMTLTERSDRNPPQRYRNLMTWSNRTVEQLFALPNWAVLDQEAPLRCAGLGRVSRLACGAHGADPWQRVGATDIASADLLGSFTARSCRRVMLRSVGRISVPVAAQCITGAYGGSMDCGYAEH